MAALKGEKGDRERERRSNWKGRKVVEELRGVGLGGSGLKEKKRVPGKERKEGRERGGIFKVDMRQWVGLGWEERYA